MEKANKEDSHVNDDDLDADDLDEEARELMEINQ